MNKKLLALLLAGVLALGGVASTVVYARGADARAYGDAELVPVLVVSQPVPAGSPADRLVGSVETKRLPKSVVPDGSVADLASLGQEATNTALVPGETLLKSRFGDKAKKVSTTDLPEGMQRLDLLLAAPRVPSGLEAGDIVGVLASYTVTGKSGTTTNVTKLALSKVRVIALDAGVAGDQGAEQLAEGVQITLAVSSSQAEKIANVAEFGKVWLTAQNDKTITEPTKGASS